MFYPHLALAQYTPMGYTGLMKKEIKKNATRRLKIIIGQIKGIEEMVDKEKYCVDIITQIEAAREGLSSVKDVMLRNHLLTHVAHQMSHGEERKAAEEMLKIYRLAQK